MAQDPNQSKFGAESTEAESHSTEAINAEAESPDLLDLAGSLHPRQKVTLIKNLITQLPSLELEVIQKLIESEEKERNEREREVFIPSLGDNPLHRIKIKKDYNFKKLELPYAQQYFVSIAQKHRIHNDIYLGVLFFVKGGYPLNYVISRQGVVQFDPATSIFQLQSSRNPEKVKFVRLVLLVPPPPDCDVTKIRPENVLKVPCFLHVEILNANLQLIDREQYQFPACMYPRQVFDRHYWDIVSLIEEAKVSQSLALDIDREIIQSDLASKSNSTLTSKSVRLPRVLNQPRMQPNLSTFIIVNHAKTSLMTSYLRQIAVLSQKISSKSFWRLHISDLNYKLLHSSEKLIVEIRVNDQEVQTGDVPLNVLSSWCRDLGMSVSQNVKSTRYTDREKEISRNLMLDFSAEVTDYFTFIEKFFSSIKGVQFKRKAKLD